MPQPLKPPPPPPSPGLNLHLVSDLDGTWIPAPDRIRGLRRLEAFLAAQPGIILTFATGRSLGSALAALEGLSRLPEHLVTDVGAALHHRGPDGSWREDAAYARWVASRWPPGLGERLARAGYPEGVRPQAGPAPCRRLALEGDPDRFALAASRVRASLERLGIRAQVIASSGRFLDVLPAGVDKGSAIAHMALPLPVMACGDSENDLGLWRIADLPVLMADHSLPPGSRGVPWNRMVRPGAPGPEGILEVLLELCHKGRTG